MINKYNWVLPIVVWLSAQNLGAENSVSADPLQITQQVLLSAQPSGEKGLIVSQDSERDVLALKSYVRSEIFKLLVTRARLLTRAESHFDQLSNNNQLSVAYMKGVNVFVDSRWMLEGCSFQKKQIGDYCEVHLHGLETVDIKTKQRKDIVFYFAKVNARWILTQSDCHINDFAIGLKAHLDLIHFLKLDISTLNQMLK
jgi:hypothetical protein